MNYVRKWIMNRKFNWKHMDMCCCTLRTVILRRGKTWDICSTRGEKPINTEWVNLTFMNPCIVIQLWKQPTRCNYTGYFIIPSQLYMFRATLSPSHQERLIVFTVSSSIYPNWCRLVSWISCNWLTDFKLIQDTSRQQLKWILTDTVNAVKCSWLWTTTSPETCRAD